MRTLIFWLLLTAGAWAQGCGPQNPNCIVPTAPPGTVDNRAASTAFVAANSLGRIKLTVPTTFFADSVAGADVATCGLASGASACASVNYLYNIIFVPNYDTGGQLVTLQFNNNDPVCLNIRRGWTGAGEVIILGPGVKGTAPTVGFTCNAPQILIQAALPATLHLVGFKLSGGTKGIDLGSNGVVNISNLAFGAESLTHMTAESTGARIRCAFPSDSGQAGVQAGAYTINGNAGIHYQAITGGVITCNNQTVTVVGSPAFSFEFAAADTFAMIHTGATSFQNVSKAICSQSVVCATGTRYVTNMGGVIQTTSGSNAFYFPGSVAGLAQTGGQYQ